MQKSINEHVAFAIKPFEVLSYSPATTTTITKENFMLRPTVGK